MSDTNAAPDYAWGQPGSSRKFHIFHCGRSLCMRWMYFGADEAMRADLLVKLGHQDCAECVKRFNSRLGVTGAAA